MRICLLNWQTICTVLKIQTILIFSDLVLECKKKKMARFTGEVGDFNKFIGPRLRNVVNLITREYRKSIGKCEVCSSTENLESAHINGKERKTLMLNAYDKYLYSKEELLDVDLNQFELDFRKLHFPLEESFKVLCRECHRKYDKKPQNPKNIHDCKNIETFKDSQTLEIELLPNDQEKFKKLLLQYEKATVKIIYFDDKIESKIWNANRFKLTSNVIGNLRSRREFRQGNWQKLGIKKVQVEIIYKN